MKSFHKVFMIICETCIYELDIYSNFYTKLI